MNEPKQNKKRQPRNEYPVQTFVTHTGMEVHALEKSACDGKHNAGWDNIVDGHNGVAVRQYAVGEHKVVIEATSGESIGLLEALTAAQDSDFAFAVLCVLGMAAPVGELPRNATAYANIDLDDVMQRIGWNAHKKSLVERDALRIKLWRYMVFASRARVVGQRTGRPYVDKVTGEPLTTYIQTALWSITKIESTESEQQLTLPELVNESYVAPRVVRVVVDPDWLSLLTSPQLAQYLAGAEMLSGISATRTSGDWARTIGLAWLRFCRCYPREVMAGERYPTRRYLLTEYTPKTSSPVEILNGANPRRAVEYWHEALEILAERGVIERKGEVELKAADVLQGFADGYKWQGAWVNETAKLRPGTAIVDSVTRCAKALPTKAPPKELKAKRQR